MREQAAEPVMGVQIAHHKAAAMKIDQRRQRVAARRHWRIGAGANLAGGSGNGEILDLADRHVLGPDQAHHAGESLAQHSDSGISHVFGRGIAAAWSRKAFTSGSSGMAVLKRRRRAATLAYPARLRQEG